jgi:Acetyltransferase (isoleucine patch superfamily)
MKILILTIKIVVYPFKVIKNLYNSHLKKYIDYVYLRFHGVETKLGYVTLNGFPIIRKHQKARIILGEGTILISNSKFNVAGVNHKIILAAMKENALIHIHGKFGASGSSIVANTKIEIMESAGIGANSHIYDNDFHPIDWSKNTEIKSAPVIIGKNVWIGANCLILKGVNIGENSVIGAGSIVTKSLNENSIYAGNPVKFIRKL